MMRIKRTTDKLERTSRKFRRNHDVNEGQECSLNEAFDTLCCAYNLATDSGRHNMSNGLTNTHYYIKLLDSLSQFSIQD
jgi:hypothetical protein